MVAGFLAEDIGRGDITTLATVPPGARARGRLVAKQPLVVAGLDVARMVFAELDPDVTVDARAHDGDSAPDDAILADLSGSARSLLTGERVALNLLQRLSGVATLTRRYVEAIQGTQARIIDTRKTMPGLRRLEKYAVTVGGGQNHRMGLDDGVLIKDNHIALAGGLRHAVEAARAAVAHLHKIQVEVEDLDQLHEALKLGVDAVLLDNMTPAETREAVGVIRGSPGGERIVIESSGGIALETVRRYAEASVDLISIGALTHSAPAVDISLELEQLP
jgi:nicotinate-nucleotide pyrophosphorylase (carboxylating)